jgi:hypothetical protein
MLRRTPEYWGGKFRLWVVLHGGMNKYKQRIVCRKCPNYNGGGYCTRLKRNLNRIMVRRDFKDVQYSKKLYNSVWACAEWIKHV